MKKTAMVFVFFVICSVCSAQVQKDSWPPEFKYFDSDFNKVNLKDYKGKTPVVISFFATYCAPCRQEIPFLIKQSAGGTAFKIILVAVDTGDAAKIKEFFSGFGVEHSWVYDPNGKIVKDFKPADLPTSVYIGKSGKIAEIEVGFTRDKIPRYTSIINSLKDK